MNCGLRISDCGFRAGFRRDAPAACHVQSAEGKVRKTNPICPAVPGGPPPPLDLPASPLRRRRLCETNPISENPPGGRDTHHFTILSFHHSSPVPIVQNEPNLARPGPKGRCVGRALRTRTNRAKQSQFPRDRAEEAPAAGAASAGAGATSVRNKANSRREHNGRGSPCRQWGSPGKTNPISWPCRVGRGLGDEGRGGQWCETKPISARRVGVRDLGQAMAGASVAVRRRMPGTAP
jgi:hypothetical protein